MITDRSSGILMAISSLPSPYGIGTLGKAAYDHIDFLKKAGQKYWQILPVGPTGYGDSPYQSFSTFAGNPYFIDLDLLVEDGLLDKQILDIIDWGSDPERVDYGKIYAHRLAVLRMAADKGLVRDAFQVADFASEQAAWLMDYALYMALKRHFDMKPWYEWPSDIRLHKAEACRFYKEALSKDIALFIYIQYLFFKQWQDMKSYANDQGIKIIGDLPIYVAYDSADVWSEPQWFQLDEENVPVEVAGVPPDYFTEDGQLWGNPLYRYDAMAHDGYDWWVRRCGGAFRLYDVLRLDHFRGLESFWAVPYGESTARNGRWIKGPGMDLVGRLIQTYEDKDMIAEDLGYLTPEVEQLLADSGLPGMKVLELAFDSRNLDSFLPHTFDKNSICYTGTHDNPTVLEWMACHDPDDVALATKYLGLHADEGYNWGMIRGGMSTPCKLFVAQMQDYLAIGEEGHMNRPGTASGNWQWRMKAGAATDELACKIREMTKYYGRG